MDATFFTARLHDAMGVSAWDDIPEEPAAESLRIADPRALTTLARLLCGEGEGVVAPLRDATCRSFPVWAFDPALSRRIALLADEEKKVVNKYGVWGLKKFMGREYEGTYRKSFLIDPEGKIAKVYDKVKPAEHAEEVLVDRRALARAGT